MFGGAGRVSGVTDAAFDDAEGICGGGGSDENIGGVRTDADVDEAYDDIDDDADPNDG